MATGLNKGDMAARALAILLALGFVAFDLNSLLSGPRIPVFILVENLAYAVLLAAPAIVYRSPASPTVIALASAFAAGRVSRSVVTSTGTLGDLAIPHFPLLLALTVLALMAAVAMNRRCVRRG
ncbi:hypothetical protein [Aeropyrum camini]|uniref:Uncharacterized protein n=1 Tax=Aeropyrum camini SY1 = JCM 12091 TaxID=1198449 RepID=U3TAU8_9CREN|nr:hypothetical protein [Aeropyrum camini]BAN89551.1 hypothetical protein ACAM_0082 [Aeropyrum camini SY1 = JCM 12091]